MLERHFADDGRVRYAEEARPGASWARNRGLELATGEIVAFIDDDVVVDPGALRTAAHAFADEAIGCVTGLILPLSLDSPAQVLHEQISTFGKGFRATRFSLPETRSLNPLFPYTPGHVGSGANTLLRTGLARRLGGFDTRLGPATPSLGGEEIDLYVRVLRSGAAIAYDPGIVVWHEHPDDLRRLDRYAFRFGVGLGAMLAKQLVAGPERLRLLRLTPAGVGYALDPTSRKNALKGQDYPSRLDVIERLGMLAGPACYLASVARARAGGALARRRGRRTSPPSPSSTGADQR
jgi:hypothetical protein